MRPLTLDEWNGRIQDRGYSGQNPRTPDEFNSILRRSGLAIVDADNLVDDVIKCCKSMEDGTPLRCDFPYGHEGPHSYERPDPMFNEDSLRRAIVSIWGEYGAHVALFDSMRNWATKWLTSVDADEDVQDVWDLRDAIVDRWGADSTHMHVFNQVVALAGLKEPPKVERVEWSAAAFEQRKLAKFPNVHVMGVRWMSGDWCYVGAAGQAIAKVHDPEIGFDGSNTVEVLAKEE